MFDFQQDGANGESLSVQFYSSVTGPFENFVSCQASQVRLLFGFHCFLVKRRYR